MDLKKACRILDIDPDVNIKELKAAYKYRCHLIHPDKVQGEEFKKKASKELQSINEAYAFLKEIISARKPKQEADDMVDIYAVKLNSLGVPLDFFGNKAGESKTVQELLSERTFIGIDFGTSTTVASYIKVNPKTGALTAEPIDIKQYDELGRVEKHHLVPSCIAWTGSKLLVGSGAAALKSEYQFGSNIWFSFKMALGENLGPQYYNSQLKGKHGGYKIETPLEAATVFFSYLRQQIEEFVSENNLPNSIYYSVSVPAAFESNQRQDLIEAIKGAHINLPEYGIIDEPNAAFISYFLDTFSSKEDLSGALAERDKNILVFDFGAGTCDISILKVGVKDDRINSQNRSISRFIALGGDNIDRQIVREHLLNQFYEQNNLSEDDFTSAEVNKALIPRLQGTAEELKISCCKYIRNNWDGITLRPFVESDKSFTTNNLEKIKIRDKVRKLRKPTLSISDFAEVMRPFLDTKNTEGHNNSDAFSVFGPIFDAIDKAELGKDELDMILFIGGSAENPFVQGAIKQYFGRFVETSNLGDIRTPVSRGAALNSFMVNGLRCEVVRSITSEPIYLLTKNNMLLEILPAGTEIPSKEFTITDLEISKDGQKKVQLPICVTNQNKILHVVEVTPSRGKSFKKGDSIKLKCHMDENKLFNVSGRIGTQTIPCITLNPLANKELTKEELNQLQAKQRLNESIAAGNGRPDINVLLDYAQACTDAYMHIEAAEAYVAAERLDPLYDFSTNICYHYSWGGKRQLSQKYSKIAFERNPSAVNAFNLALDLRSDGDTEGFEKYLQKAHEKEPLNPTILDLYGHHLLNRNRTTEGMEMIRTAFDLFKEALDKGELKRTDFGRLESVARTLGEDTVVAEVNRLHQEVQEGNKGYDDDNLAVSTKRDNLRIRG